MSPKPAIFMATSPKISLAIPLLFLYLACLYQSSSPHSISGEDPSVSSYSFSHSRNLAGQRRSNQIPDCAEMLSRSQCSQNQRCRWCRSEALDDMCFSKAEAWRLPLQVFSCD